MYCNNPIEHTVKAGDTLYKLSKQYKTTVASLIFSNPKVNPYNLQVGMTLMVCPGREYVTPIPFWQLRNSQDMEGPSEMNIPSPVQIPQNTDVPQNMGMMDDMETSQNRKQNQNAQEQKLRELMRLAWLEHVYLMRMFLVSAVGDINDQQEIVEKMIENVDEIAGLFAKYYPQNVVNELRDLLMEHIELTGSYITMKRAGEDSKEDELLKQMKENNEKIADLLAGETPEYDRSELLDMLSMHQQLFAKEITERFAGDYKQDMQTFVELRNHAIQMADYLSHGLMMQVEQSGLDS